MTPKRSVRLSDRGRSEGTERTITASRYKELATQGLVLPVLDHDGKNGRRVAIGRYAAVAVFLSYASQDAAAVERICEAPRTAGIAACFDQTELRGGDAWGCGAQQAGQGVRSVYRLVSKNTEARSSRMSPGEPCPLPIRRGPT